MNARSHNLALSGFADIAHRWQPAGEKIGVHSIKVVDARLHATAVVGTFFAADKLLLGWANQFQGVLECEFEILYNDGRKISGQYRFRRKGVARPALMNFVRAHAQALCEDGASPCAVEGLAARPFAFLERYETDDFASQ